MHLIGITGKARAGKDSLASCLATEEGDVRGSFARPIKEGLSTILDVPLEFLESTAKDEQLEGFDFSPRRAMQTLGTEWGRSLDEDIWIKLQEKRFKKYAQDPHRKDCFYVISDVRFNNEAEWVISMGGIVVRVMRDNLPDVEGHSSEQGVSVSLIDEIVINNGGFNHLHTEARELRRKLLKQPA